MTEIHDNSGGASGVQQRTVKKTVVGSLKESSILLKKGWRVVEAHMVFMIILTGEHTSEHTKIVCHVSGQVRQCASLSVGVFVAM